MAYNEPVRLEEDAGPARASQAPQSQGAVMGRSSGQFRSTGTQVNLPAATTEKPSRQLIVDEEAILQLMKNCPMCSRKCRCSKRTRGPYLIVYQSCYFCSYQRKWANQPEANNISIQAANTKPKKKVRAKSKASVNVKSPSSQVKRRVSELTVSAPSVSQCHDPLETERS